MGFFLYVYLAGAIMTILLNLKLLRQLYKSIPDFFNRKERTGACVITLGLAVIIAALWPYFLYAILFVVPKNSTINKGKPRE